MIGWGLEGRGAGGVVGEEGGSEVAKEGRKVGWAEERREGVGERPVIGHVSLVFLFLLRFKCVASEGRDTSWVCLRGGSGNDNAMREDDGRLGPL